MWIDHLEKLGRLLLWLTIVSAFVIVSLGYAKHDRAEGELRIALQKAKDQLADAMKPKPIERLEITSMGTFLYGLNQATGIGHVTFTNVSPRSGILCVYGRAKNPATARGINSLPACQQVQPYASLVDMKLLFASGDVDSICGRTKCEIDIADEPTGDNEQIANK
jgi:hypothetical protein